MTITLSDGKAYEQTSEWPSVTKVFNMSAFQYPEKRFSTATQAPDQRAQAYLRDPYINFRTRGQPQLTFFEGTYDVYAHDSSGNPFPCKYPNVVTPLKNGRRECLDPTRLTPTERALLDAQRAKDEAAFASEVAAQKARQGDLTYTGPVVKGLGASDGEMVVAQEVARKRSLYRSTEFALVGLFAAGLFLMWRK